MEAIRKDVLIVGAGPTGLTLACALARAGVSFHLIDKLEQRSPYSRALVVHLRSLEIFNQLGIAAGLLEQGNRIKGFRVHARRKFKFELNLAALLEHQFSGCRFRGALLIEQDRTEAALDKCLAQLGHQALFKHELVSFEEEAEGVRASCRDAKGQTYSIECQYIAGCDGAHSVVRHQKQIPFEGSAYEQDFMLADVDIEWDQPREFFQGFLDRQGFLALGPMTEKTRLIAAMGRYREDAPEPTLEDFRRLLARLAPYNFTISNPAWIARFHLHHRIADRFRAGRAYLAGDAAHVHSPAGGQGMNTGIQDAWNLGWKLVWALRGGDSGRAGNFLDTYHEERYPVGKALIETTDRAFNLIAGQTRISRFVRTYIVPWLIPLAANITPLLRRGMYRITQLGIGYRGSSLCGPDPDRRHFTKTLAPGDRMPDIDVNGDSLHQLLDPAKPTILVAGTQEPVESDAYKVVRLPEPTGEVQALLGINSHGLFLIRPDAHLAARAITQEGLKGAHLLRFLPG